jgi:hypothetical protein
MVQTLHKQLLMHLNGRAVPNQASSETNHGATSSTLGCTGRQLDTAGQYCSNVLLAPKALIITHLQRELSDSYIKLYKEALACWLRVWVLLLECSM